MSKFKPGQSGNPRGRPKGAKAGSVQALRERLGQDVGAIMATVVQSAMQGDVAAAKLVLERILPALKPQELATPMHLPSDGTLTDQGRAVLGAVAAGQVPPSTGTALIGALASMARVTEIDELVRRIEALEKAADESN